VDGEIGKKNTHLRIKQKKLKEELKKERLLICPNLLKKYTVFSSVEDNLSEALNENSSFYKK